MKFLLPYLALGFFLSLFPCYAQSNQDQKESLDSYIESLRTEFDHLEPVNSFFSSYSYEREYYALIDSILMKDLSMRPLARLLILPSFEPEYVISVDCKEEKCYVSYVSASLILWDEIGMNNNYKNTIKVEKRKRIIGCDLAEQMKSLYDLAIQQSRFTSLPAEGADGVSYYFSIFSNYGLRSARKWSPIEGTKISELIKLTESLANDGTTPDAEFSERIDKLLDKF